MKQTKKKILPGGWLGEYLRRDINGFAGRMDEFCSFISDDIFGATRISNSNGFQKTEFEEREKQWWNGESRANWMDGVIRLANVTSDADFDAKIKQYISHELKNQDIDGYIGIYKRGDRFNHHNENGEFWCQGRMWMALMGAREIEAVERAADLLIKHYGEGRSYFNHSDRGGCGTAHGLMIIEALVELHEQTGKKEYVDFAEWAYADFSNASIIDNYADMQARNIENASRPLQGHGAHTAEHLRIPLLLFHATGKKTYLELFRAAEQKLTPFFVPSGSIKSDEHIGDSHEFFRTNILRPTASDSHSWYEFCTTAELALSWIAAARILNDDSYLDRAEWLFYNAAMGSRLPDGSALAYLGSDNRTEAVKHADDIFSWRHKYSPAHEDVAVCCNPNSLRLDAYFANNLFLCRDNLIKVQFYSECRLETTINGGKVIIEEHTGYPFDHHIEFEIKTGKSFIFELHLPGWCETPLLNGEPAPRRLEITGDTVLKLDLKSKPRTQNAADGSIYHVYGPLLYSLPIAHVESFGRRYATDLADREFVPEKRFYDQVLPVAEIVMAHRDSKGYPWDKSPVVMHIENLELLPIGCTVLRKTNFES